MNPIPDGGGRSRLRRLWAEGLDATGHGPALRNMIQEFLRFAVVGGAAVAVHYTVLVSLVELGRAPVIAATSAGYVCGATFSYIFNRRFTFKHRPEFRSGLMLYMTLGLSGLVLNGALVALLLKFKAPYMVAQVFATGVVTCWNFLVAKFAVFRGSRSGT